MSNLAADETAYYLRAVAQIRSHWPAVDLKQDSLSATAPGYPYLLAGLSQVFGHSVLALRTINWVLSLGVVALLWHMLQQTGGSRMTFLLLPLVLDNFFIKSAGYVVTDNVALLGMVGTLILIFRDNQGSKGLFTSITATLSVCIRQTSIWLIAPFMLSSLWHNWRHRPWYLLLCLLPIIPLVAMVLAWGGLVPPDWRQVHIANSTVSAMPLLYVLTLMAVFGMPFYFIWTDRAAWRADLHSLWSWIPTGLALVLAIVTPSLPGMAQGHWGGYWWNMAAHVPAIGKASSLFLLLAPWGAWLAGALLHRLWQVSGAYVTWLYTTALGGWLLSLIGNRQVFQRYFETALIIFLIIWAVLISQYHPGQRTPRIWPMVALGAVQLGITLITAVAQSQGWVNFR